MNNSGFISIDEKESSNLKKICDEIFGEFNFISNIIWQSRSSISNDHKVSLNHNNTFIYAKNIDYVQFGGELLDEQEYINPDEDVRGPWKLVPIDANHTGGETYYPIENPKTKVSYYPPNGRIWAYNKQGFEKLYNEGRIKFGINDESSPKRKLYLRERLERGDRKTPSSLLLDAGTTKDGTNEIMQMFDNKKVFDYPKPTSFIKRLLTYGSVGKDDVILDFFSGSGTTAHATMQLNAEDGGNRKFIMIQMQEQLNENSVGYKEDFRSICDIGEERIRRAGEKIKEEMIENINKEGLLTENVIDPNKLDVGFKVFKLDTSNITAWQADFEDLEKNIDLFESNFVPGRTHLDIVYEVMLKNGLDITYPVESHEYEEFIIYDVAKGNLFICLSEDITRKSAIEIVQLKGEYGLESGQVIFKDNGFKNDSEKLNSFEILKGAGYEDTDLMSI